MRRLASGLVLVGLTLTAGCGGESAGSGAPEIAYGEAVCAACRMVVGDSRYAAALRNPDGGVEVFDSIECLILRLREAPRPARDVWMADHAGTGLHPAGGMTVVRADYPSPMGKGYAAFLDAGVAWQESERRGGISGPLEGFAAGTVRRVSR